MKLSFPPLASNTCTTLILGSLPGDLSLEKQQYYAHPRNCFWKIMFEIFGETYSDEYKTKCEKLLKHNIALWDVVMSAEREGSLDADIKNVIPNDIAGFLESHKLISKIILNGGKSTSLFKKYFKDIDIDVISLPSTSPANATMTFEKKLILWKQAILTS